MTGRPDRTTGQLLVAAGIGYVIALASALAPQPVVAQDFAQAGNAPATQQITEYLGGGYLTLGEACADYGWTGTHQVMVRAQPQGRRGNPRDESQLAIYFATGVIAMRYDIDEETLYSPAPVDEASYVWNGPWSPMEPTMTISYRTRYGDSLHSNDSDLQSVFLTIGNFNEHPDCVATMRVSLGRL
jgi:hypothetical protein